MEYVKTEWKDLPDTTTPITASALNNIEDGVEYLFEHGLGVEINDNYSNSTTDSYSCNYVNNLTGKILWTNPDPTQAITTDTEISLSSSDYDILEIFFQQRTHTTLYTYSAKMLKSSTGTRLYLPTTDGNMYRNFTKNTDTSYTISTMVGHSQNDNTLVIPLYIIGYKTGLFS